MNMAKLWITIIVQIILLIPASSGQQLDCGRGGEAVERSTHTLTCGGLQASYTVQWTKKDQNSATIAIASCAGYGTCQNNYPSRYEVTRANGTTSSLTILQVTRDLSSIGGDWTCTAFSSSTCSITVIYPPDHDGCEVRFDETSDKVLGQCVLHKIYPSPTCTWSEQFQGGQWIQIPHNQTTLTETQFVDSSNSQVYIRATCQLHRPLPVTVGSYSYKVLVIPGHVEPVVNFTSANTIRLPVSPSLTSSCPSDYVTDARIASCPCVTSDLGSPPARLVWLDPDGRSVVSASTLTLALTFNDVTAGYNGGTYHCEVQHHTGSSRVPYIPKIAVRPNKPTVGDHNNNTAFSPGQTITLQCAADGGRPAITQLVLQCPGQPDAPGRQEGGTMISSLTLTLAVSNDGTFCTCVADNGYLSSESGIFVLKVSDGGGGLSQTTIIIIAVVCCIVLLSVVVAVVVVYLRNKGPYSSLKEGGLKGQSGSAPRKEEVQQAAHSNPVYDHAITVEQQSSENHYDLPTRLNTEEEEFENIKKTAGLRKAKAMPISPKINKATGPATGTAANGNTKTRRETSTVVQHDLDKDTMEEKAKTTKAAEISDKSDRRYPLSTRRSSEQDKSEHNESSYGLSDDKEQIPDDKLPDISAFTSSAQDFEAHEQDQRDAPNRKVINAWSPADSKHVEPPTAYHEQSQSPVQKLRSYPPSARSAQVADDNIEEDNKHSEKGDINTERSRKIGHQTQGKKDPRPMVYPQNHKTSGQQSFNLPADDSGGSVARIGRQRPKSGVAPQHEVLRNKEFDQNSTFHPRSPRPVPVPRASSQQGGLSKSEVQQFLFSIFKPDGENKYPPTEDVIEDSTVHGSTGRGGRRSSDITGGMRTISGAGRRAEDESSWSVDDRKPHRSRSLSNIPDSRLSEWKVSEEATFL